MRRKIRLALIAGGRSGERAVSLQGAEAVVKALDPQKYILHRYDPAVNLPQLVADAPHLDCAFILLHGPGGEDGAIQGLLDLLQLPYQGTGILGSALAMDKCLAKRLYRLIDLPTPAWTTCQHVSLQECDRILSTLALPLFVKPLRQGSSLGMSRVDQVDELEGALKKGLEHDDTVLIEVFSPGTEITVGVLGNDEPTALPPVEIIPAVCYNFFDYEAKYQPEATEEICPARLSPLMTEKVQAYALQAHDILQLRGYSRTDMIVNGDTVSLLETNTIPGMTTTSLLPQAAAVHGLSFDRLLDRLIALALEQCPQKV